MVTRRTMLQWGAATGAGLLVPLAYRQGVALAASKSGLFFGYTPFTQPLFIPEVLTPLAGRLGLRLGAVDRTKGEALPRTGGLAIGAALTPLVTKAAGTLLFGLQPTDAPTFTIAVVALATAIAASSYLPARRASRVDPIVALRHD